MRKMLFMKTALLMLGFVVANSAGAVELDILDTHSYWRCHVTLQPPVIGTATNFRLAFAEKIKKSRLKPLPLDQPSTPFPRLNWAQTDFDDSDWWRDPGPFFGGNGGTQSLVHSPHASLYGGDQSIALALLCLRGKFNVTDPGLVKRLVLSCDYRGGVRVYLNGTEIARKNLKEGTIGLDLLAEDYPDEVASIPNDGRSKKTAGEREKRIRHLNDIEIPVKLLRKGLNVLAFEVHRCATHPKLWKTWSKAGSRVTTESFVWSTVGLMSVRLSAEGGGVVSNTRRPTGVQVWNANVSDGVFVTDYGDPNETLKPVRIVATRNGAFSGQVVVSSDVAITGLKAELAPFVSKKDASVATGVQGVLRYPGLGRVESYAKSTLPIYSGRKCGVLKRFEILVETPPVNVPVAVVKTTNKGKVAVAAVQPIWIKVRISSGTAPGLYESQLTIDVGGSDSVKVPVRLEVFSYKLPDPGDFVTWADFIQSPETLSLCYNVPLWSDAHFKLIEKTFKILAEVGNKTLYIPLLARSNVGNSETMVRWIKKDDGGYEHDFEPMEKYLDLALKCGLKPKSVCLHIWDYHVGHALDVKLGHLGASRGEPGSRPVPVTLWDKATGKTKEMLGPAYADASAEAFWAPVAKGIMERLKARGLDDVAMVGLCGDSVPGKEVVQLWNKLLPKVPWEVMAHGWSKGNSGGLYDRQRVGYVAFVVGSWGVDPGIRRDYGWQAEDYATYFPRLTAGLPLSFHRAYFELAMQSGRLGMGRLAADFFPQSFTDRRKSRSISSRYRESSWHNLNLRAPWLAPGPDGALSTSIMENALAGIQECEARVFIEKALLDKTLRAKIPKELAERCQDLLDKRTRHIAWASEFSNVWGTRHSFLHSTGGVMGAQWYSGGSLVQDLAASLFATAGEVATAIGVQ